MSKQFPFSNRFYIALTNPEKGVALKATLYAALLALSIIMSASAQVDVTKAFFPSGTMGDWSDMALDEASTENPHMAPYCIKITYTAAQSQGKGVAGICWQYPDSNTGSEPGRNLSNSTRITFWARGALSNEVAEFSAGGGLSDSFPKVSTGPIILLSQWQHYTLDLSGQDLSSVTTGFCMTATKNQNPTGSVVYLDEILYE
ncbi:MAG: hypothetical protein LUQ38_08495 [Methanotrichaceae archaeon]|nr:hypothetical protein [Methanotrichaceae archaeon]